MSWNLVPKKEGRGRQICRRKKTGRWVLDGDTQETTEATEPEDVPEGGNEIPEKNDKQGGISPVVIVVCVLGVLVLAAGTVLVVILVKRKKQ